MFEEKKQNLKENLRKDERLDIKVGRTKKDSKLIVWFIQYKKVFIFFEVVLFFIISYIFLFGPQLVKVVTSKQILYSKEQSFEEAKSFKLKVEELKNERDGVINKDNQYVKKLYEVLPQKQNLPEIMAQIDALTKSFGLVLGSIQIENPQEDSSETSTSEGTETPNIGERIKTIQVTIFVLGGDGSYAKVKELLGGLEKHIRLLDITSFGFDPAMTTYSIVFKTYYLD